MEDIAEQESLCSTIAVVGLGYVGLPLAAAFGRKGRVIGFDIDEQRIARLLRADDATGELTAEELRATSIDYTSSPPPAPSGTFSPLSPAWSVAIASVSTRTI